MSKDEIKNDQKNYESKKSKSTKLMSGVPKATILRFYYRLVHYIILVR